MSVEQLHETYKITQKLSNSRPSQRQGCKRPEEINVASRPWTRFVSHWASARDKEGGHPHLNYTLSHSLQGERSTA